VKEATLRDVLRGTTPASRLSEEVQESVETLSGSSRRVYIDDLPGDEQVTITPEMLVRLCDAFHAGAVTSLTLEISAFAILASAHFRWSEEDEVVGRVIQNWASPEVTWALTSANVRMFRNWLTGHDRPPSEPEVTTDSLSDLGMLRRTSKVPVPAGSAGAPNALRPRVQGGNTFMSSGSGAEPPGKGPMTSELQPATGRSVDLAPAHRTSLVRALVVCAVWVATLSLREVGPSVRLGLDLVLTAGGLWAAAPGRRAGGPLFGEDGHWTSLVIALPIGFGIAAAAELWHMLRATGG
jgi:hypothetical protein